MKMTIIRWDSRFMPVALFRKDRHEVWGFEERVQGKDQCQISDVSSI